MVLGVSGLSGQCVAKLVVMGHRSAAGCVMILNQLPGELRVLELALKRNIVECVIAVSQG